MVSTRRRQSIDSTDKARNETDALCERTERKQENSASRQTSCKAKQKAPGKRRKSADEDADESLARDVACPRMAATTDDSAALSAHQSIDDNIEKEEHPKQHVVDVNDKMRENGDEAVRTVSVALAKRKAEERDYGSEESNVGNELTKLIPGYVAPLGLDTSSLDRYRPSGGLAELCRQAERTDASTAGFVAEATETHVKAMKTTPNGFMPSSYAQLYSSFKQGAKDPPDDSAGKGWFNMVPTPMTEELKTDLAVIRNRNYLDPKRFYKSADKNKSKVMQLGTVVEGSAEFYSARLTKKQRRTNLTEEIMADPDAAGYTKNKYKSMQQSKAEQARKYSKKKLSKRQRRGY